jgi:hypothetical protein
MTWMKSGLSIKDKGRSFDLNQLIHVASIPSISFAMASSGVRAELEVDPNFWAIFLMFGSWTVVGIGLMVVLGGILPGAFVLAGAICWLMGYVFLALVSSALKGVYTAALYRYAITGEAGHFDPNIMGNAFRPK